MAARCPVKQVPLVLECYINMSRLDQIFRSVLLTKFFTKGWGNSDNLKRLFEFRKILSCRDTCQTLVPPNYPVYIDEDRCKNGVRVIDGHFTSPFTIHLPNIMPPEAEIARFQMILPKDWNTRLKPVCIHLAGTGDHYFWRRRMLLAQPLVKDAGIASIILENPYYGVRKPKQQVRSSLHNVSDLFVMGGGLVLESLVLLRWCEAQGYGPLGMTGISMGGHMASVAVTNWHKPISLVPIMSGCTASYIFTQMASLAASSWVKPISLIPCLSWSTASVVFTQGVLSSAIPWDLLQQQYFADSNFEDEVAKLIESPELDRAHGAFSFGQKFARNYPSSLADMEALQKNYVSSSSGESGEFSASSSVESESKVEEKLRLSSQMSMSSGRLSSPPSSSVIGSSMSSASAASVRHHTTSSDIVTSAVKRLRSIGGIELLRRSSGDPSEELQRNQKEAWWFMRGVMDECTHLGNFCKPVDTDLIIIVAAQSDAYVPRSSVRSLEELWPGSEVRYINSGHISAFLFNQYDFRKAIIDSFDRQIAKYYT